MSDATKAKERLRCGQTARSYKPEKKWMKKVCENGNERIIHAGASAYTSNKTAKQRKNFRTRQKCETADPNTPRGLACQKWTPKAESVRGKSAEKRKAAKDDCCKECEVKEA